MDNWNAVRQCLAIIPIYQWKRKQSCMISCISIMLLLSFWVQRGDAAQGIEPLELSLSPSSAPGGEMCVMHPEPGAESGRPSQAVKPGKSDQIGKSGRPGGRPSGAVHESEHRPVPRRTYHFNDHRRRADVKAFVRRPDGTIIEPEVHLGYNPGLSFPTPMGDGPVHGANSVYVVEQGIEENTLLVRTAKWITMHHSCSWGHDGKFDKTLIQPQPLATIPFEVVINNLWDPNYHAAVETGDQLKITVLSYGEPVPGARVTLTTEKGWSKEVVADQNGVATLQLIRDYYPVSWDRFKRTHRGKFLVTARHDFDRIGIYRDKPYQRISYLTTLPWKYSPAQQDYSSYMYGLLITVLTMIVSGVGVYAYRERRRKPYKGITFDE